MTISECRTKSLPFSNILWAFICLRHFLCNFLTSLRHNLCLKKQQIESSTIFLNKFFFYIYFFSTFSITCQIFFPKVLADFEFLAVLKMLSPVYSIKTFFFLFFSQIYENNQNTQMSCPRSKLSRDNIRGNKLTLPPLHVLLRGC